MGLVIKPVNRFLYWFKALWRLALFFGRFIEGRLITLFKLLRKPTTWIGLLFLSAAIAFTVGFLGDRNRWLWYTVGLIFLAGLLSLFGEFYVVKNKLAKVFLTLISAIALGIAINITTDYFYDVQCEKHLNFVLERIDDNLDALSIADLKEALNCAYRDEDKAKILTRLAEAHFESGSSEGLYEALQEAKRALGIYESLALEDSRKFLAPTAYLHCFLGRLYKDVGYLRQAFWEISTSINLYKKISKTKKASYEGDLARCYRFQGLIKRRLGY